MTYNTACVTTQEVYNTTRYLTLRPDQQHNLCMGKKRAKPPISDHTKMTGARIMVSREAVDVKSTRELARKTGWIDHSDPENGPDAISETLLAQCEAGTKPVTRRTAEKLSRTLAHLGLDRSPEYFEGRVDEMQDAVLRQMRKHAKVAGDD